MSMSDEDIQEIKLDMFRSIGTCRSLLLRGEPLTAEERAMVVDVLNVLEEMIETAAIRKAG